MALQKQRPYVGAVEAETFTVGWKTPEVTPLKTSVWEPVQIQALHLSWLQT